MLNLRFGVNDGAGDLLLPAFFTNSFYNFSKDLSFEKIPIRTGHHLIRQGHHPIRTGQTPIREGHHPIWQGTIPIREPGKSIRLAPPPIRPPQNPIRLAKNFNPTGSPPYPAHRKTYPVGKKFLSDRVTGLSGWGERLSGRIN